MYYFGVLQNTLLYTAVLQWKQLSFVKLNSNGI